MLTNIWKGVGYGSIIYLAAMLGINQEYYEAAMLDGANKPQQIRYITLPHLLPAHGHHDAAGHRRASSMPTSACSTMSRATTVCCIPPPM